jgi:hypothetical protein
MNLGNFLHRNAALLPMVSACHVASSKGISFQLRFFLPTRTRSSECRISPPGPVRAQPSRPRYRSESEARSLVRVRMGLSVDTGPSLRSMTQRIWSGLRSHTYETGSSLLAALVVAMFASVRPAVCGATRCIFRGCGSNLPRRCSAN